MASPKKMDVDPVDVFNRDSDVLQKFFPGYEHRPQQERMAGAVRDALTNKRILLSEAGTGVGKTMSYLMPAASYALENEVKAVISTETRSLQTQILKKDLPAAQKVLGKKIRAELCFGAGNYLCRRKLEEVINQGNIDSFMEDHVEEFLEWVDETRDGLVFEYTGKMSSEFRRRVVRDADDCLGSRSPYFNQCFYYQAKEKWKEADILVVNHSLLSFHLMNERKVLPGFRYLIIDEAHRFPEAFSKAVTRQQTLSGVRGLLRSFTRKSADVMTRLNEWERSLVNNNPLFENQTLRIKDPLTSKEQSDFIEELDKTRGVLARQKEELERKAEAKEGLEGGQNRGGEEMVRLQIQIRLLEDLIRFMGDLDAGPGEERVHWMHRSYDAGGPEYELFISRLNTGYLIRTMLLERMASVVFASATLTASGRDPFHFFLNEIGLVNGGDSSFIEMTQNDGEMQSGDFDSDELDEESVEEDQFYYTDGSRADQLILSSPFQYEKQAMLYIPDGIPDPSGEEERFHKRVADEIMALCEISDGGAFVLFTSNRSLKEVHSLILKKSPKLKKNLFSQAELGSGGALRKFQDSKKGILLGLATFWQGIDIAGDQLRMVIMVRLPFRVPDEPILEARTEKEKSKGRSPFITLQLPQAVISIKQGFGRLIRTKNDRGAVAILDPRIRTKGYGRDILKSLPKTKIVQTIDEVKERWNTIFTS